MKNLTLCENSEKTFEATKLTSNSGIIQKCKHSEVKQNHQEKISKFQSDIT